MKCSHHKLLFELPDAWIKEGGATSFKPKDRSYAAKSKPESQHEIKIIDIRDVEPCLDRQETCGIFCDKKDGTLTAKERVVSILKAIVSDAQIDPVEMLPSLNGRFKYRLTHGCHRFHCSIAMEFEAIPMIEGFDFDA